MVESKLISGMHGAARDISQRFVRGRTSSRRAERSGRYGVRSPREPRSHSTRRSTPASVPQPAARSTEPPAFLRPEQAQALTVLLDEHLGEHGVRVLVRGDTATLRGWVGTSIDRLIAEDLAFSLEGIERCCDLLAVDET